MTEFQRNKGENFESFLRRFNKALKQDGRLYAVRKKQYLTPKKNKSQQKKSALFGMKTRSNKEYLRKTGKLPEDFKDMRK